ncbi:MAG: response regulator [Synechococcales cyanobacterium C42_A2020_086]|nr:response regulator [Synechococcales cyanobacterium C42_A2020_086]
MLRSRQFDEQMTARALETIERNAKLQTQLIEDLLDVSRILQGKLLLNISQVSLVSTIEAALETVRHAAESRTTDLRFLILAAERNGTSSQTAITAWQNGISEKAAEAYHAGFTVSGDSARLQQIVWNLVSNAVKFTPAGGKVEVKLEQIEIGKATVGNEQTPHPSHPLASSPPQSYAQITVTDTGKGIHPDFLPYVFDYFRQADSTTTRQYGGLGLGLAIVRHLVELHGGSIRVESAGEGQGATFIVMLPLLKEKPRDLVERNHAEPAVETAEPDAVSAMTQTETAVLQGVRVLVVDDDADMREYAAYVLQQAGANVTLATSAGEALAKLSRVKPDVLVSDIGMSNVDGYALLRQIRSLVPELGGQVPAIAVTAYAGEYDQQRAQEAGFQLHVPKPVDPEVLIRAVVSLLAE